MFMTDTHCWDILKLMSLYQQNKYFHKVKDIILENCRSIPAVYEYTEKQYPSICTTTQDGQREIFLVPKDFLSIQLCNYKHIYFFPPLCEDGLDAPDLRP